MARERSVSILASLALMTSDGSHVTGSSQGASLFALPRGVWAGSVVPMAKSTILVSARGLVEVIGEDARRALRCRIADRLFPFELCEDRVTQTALFETIAGK